jgi:serine/threonine protein kinase
VDGFSAGIGKAGIASGSGKNKGTLHKLPMNERLCVLCKLGQGASSIVYKALDLSEMRLVAVKMISVFDRTKRRQMVRELSTLFEMLRSRKKMINSAVLEEDHEDRQTQAHPHLFSTSSNNLTIEEQSVQEPSCTETKDRQSNIVDFYDAFSNLEDGGVALMMEYLDGGSLQDIVDLGGCRDEGTLANIAIQALQGLEFLHSCNQIHRDIKPGNLLIDQHGVVKVNARGYHIGSSTCND